MRRPVPRAKSPETGEGRLERSGEHRAAGGSARGRGRGGALRRRRAGRPRARWPPRSEASRRSGSRRWPRRSARSTGRRGAGLQIERVAGGFRVATRSEVGAWVRRFFRQRNRTRLSPAALETLAIVAYRQPITAPEIQAIRGVDPSASLKSLVEKKLVRILGKKKVVGHPLLYGTSRHFLVHFGLDRLQDLPPIDDFQELLGAGEPSPSRRPSPRPSGRGRRDRPGRNRRGRVVRTGRGRVSERLQKVLAHAGIASRRAAETLISAGRVTVNGEVVTRLGTSVDPARDTIRVDGKKVRPPGKATSISP